MTQRLGGIAFLFAFLVTFCVGCGSGGYRVSGNVKFKGQPVPSGKIYFHPDTAKGNSGATGYADIRNGQYDTSRGGRNAPGGPMIIALQGIDPSKPPEGAESDVTATVLFPHYEITVELPRATSTKDIDVPEAAAAGPVGPKVAPAITP
jgi:hypothetical protein